MPVVLLSIFVPDTKIMCGYNFVAPLRNAKLNISVSLTIATYNGVRYSLQVENIILAKSCQ